LDGKILDDWENGSVIARLGGGNNCIVPGLRGATVPKARTDLKKASCGARIEPQFSKKVARGRVILTRPRAGLRVPGGTKVRVVVSRGRYGR
jgi:beta-lactam-binding protein with PASTA domain